MNQFCSVLFHIQCSPFGMFIKMSEINTNACTNVYILILSYVSGNTKHFNVRLKVHLTTGKNGKKSQ